MLQFGDAPSSCRDYQHMTREMIFEPYREQQESTGPSRTQEVILTADLWRNFETKKSTSFA
jgi:hypothetical protein